MKLNESGKVKARKQSKEKVQPRIRKHKMGYKASTK